MSRPRKWLMAAVATISTITFIAATGCWAGAVRYTDIDTLWLALGFTILGAVLGLVWLALHVIHRVEACHEVTRQKINATVDQAVRRIADRVVLEIFTSFDNIAREQVEAANRLDRAQRRWRASVGTDTPIDMQQWRGQAVADGAAQS